jgi:SAM-dependent methyltransferase
MQSLRQAYVHQARTAGFPEHWSGPAQMVERIARIVGTRPDHLVLDLGAGIGGPARRLASVVGCRVVGIDLVEEVVRAGARRGGPVRYAVANAEALPLATGRIDQVWALGVLAHVPDLERALGEAFRVLRSGGALVATEVFRTSSEEAAFTRTAPRPWRPLGAGETRGRLRAVGFRDVRLLDWPGHDAPERSIPEDPGLRDDLASGRLRPVMVVAARP